MNDTEHSPDWAQRPTRQRPLLGLTILVVEDSKFACDALRLLCLRSGARIRRADCLQSARRHLQVYRPSVAIVDMFLPDGSGADLIAELASASPRIGVILGLSGDSAAGSEALEAGADGFLEKPFAGVAAFQHAILSHLSPDRQPVGLRAADTAPVTPDRITYREDMAHAAEALGDATDGHKVDYVAQFLIGVGRIADDGTLVSAAEALTSARSQGEPVQARIAQLAGLVQDRLTSRAVI
ncbi:response regulator [Thalassococcus sp. BH17M4-6]|uniref:response regulator n=1 Tax=Thalassococcus sp. BH17M4-6 TaxID=3413148 RepID=UPI003BC8CAB8